jgi:hypothetical protein
MLLGHRQNPNRRIGPGRHGSVQLSRAIPLRGATASGVDLRVQWWALAFDTTSLTWTSMGRGRSGDIDNVLPDTLPASANLPRSVTP